MEEEIVSNRWYDLVGGLTASKSPLPAQPSPRSFQELLVGWEVDIETGDVGGHILALAARR